MQIALVQLGGDVCDAKLYTLPGQRAELLHTFKTDGVTGDHPSDSMPVVVNFRTVPRGQNSFWTSPRAARGSTTAGK